MTNIKEKMRGFRRYEWTSQMVENARKQGKWGVSMEA